MSFTRIAQLGILAFVGVGVLYTTKSLCQFFVTWMSSLPVLLWTQGNNLWHSPHGLDSPALYSDVFDHLDASTFSSLEKGPYHSGPARAPPATSVYWDSSLLGQQFSNRTAMTAISQETFLSKAFSNSLHPTRILPYFYRASGAFDRDDVTITTLVTSNRFKVLKQLVNRYQGAYLPSLNSSYYSSFFRTDLCHHSHPISCSDDPSRVTSWLSDFDCSTRSA